MTLENFISYFENTRKTSSGYTAKCSAHEDKINSLSISESDGKILLYCHAGCKPEEIVKSKNLEMKDLFTESKNYDTQNTQEYIYTDENNKILFKSVRWYNGDKKSFCLKRYNVGTWINGLNNIKLVVYKLPKVLEAVKENTPIFIVEGEKDVENLLKLGFTATTNPMGAGKWRKYFNHHFENAQVYIIPDNDKPGKQHAKNTCENLKGIAKKLRIIDLENLEEHEDITDYLHKNCKTKKEAINEIKNLMSIAKPYASSAFRDIRDENSENQEIKWDKLIPLDEIQILEFPIEVFPPVISEYLEALSINTQTSPEMAGILILGVLAVCNQGKYKVKIHSNYSEQLSLYVTAVAEPAELKSAVINAVTAPIKDYQSSYNKEHKIEIAQSISTYNRLKKRVEELEKDFAKGKVSDEEVNFEIEEIEKFQVKYPLKLFTDNATTEKLVDIMDKQGGKISVISSEGGILKNFGSGYTKGEINIDPYLKAHDGDSISFDRVNRPSNYIENPALSMIITTQPKRINKFIQSEDYRESGLVARFLIVFCKSNIGRRNVNPPNIPQSIEDSYYNLITEMLRRKASNVDITLSEESFQKYLEFKSIVENKLPDEWHFMRDFGGKVAGAMLRIAGLLHCAKNEKPETQKIAVQTINKAIDIINCVSSHIQKAYQCGGVNEEIEGAKYVLKRINSLNKIELKKQELYQACKGRIKGSEELDVYVGFLEKNNYLKKVIEYTGNRPSEKIILNPENLSLISLNSNKNINLGILGMKNTEGKN